MRSVIALIVFVSLAAIAIPAQSTHYTFGNQPSVGNENVYPFRTGPNWRYQVLVPPGRMPSQKIKISEIAVAAAQTGTWTASSMVVKMSTVASRLASTRFAANLGPCPATVFSGVPRISHTIDQWADIGLQNTFVYDGTVSPKPALVVEFCILQVAGRLGIRTVTNITDASRTWLQTNTNPCQAPTGSTDPGPLSGAPKLRLRYGTRCLLTASSTVQLGTFASVVVDRAPVGDGYQIAASFSDSASLTLGPCRIALAVDPLFLASLQGGPVFQNYSGQVATTRPFRVRLRVPAIRALTGVCLFHAAAFFNRSGITCCTNTAGTMIVR